jgi:anti-sigma B factor antagonist
VTGIPILPVVTVTISGEIDIATSRAMRDALATGPGPARLEVDLSAVTFMDASGIGVLLAARQRVVDGGGSLTLRAPSRAVRRLTGVLGLDELLDTRLGPSAHRDTFRPAAQPRAAALEQVPGVPSGGGDWLTIDLIVQRDDAVCRDMCVQ